MSDEDWNYMVSFLEPGSHFGGTLASVLEQIPSEEKKIEFCRHFKLAWPLCKVKAILNSPPSDDPT